EEFATALEIFKPQKAFREEAWCAYNIAYCASFTGQDGQLYAERVLEIAQHLNDRLLEARAYHALCFSRNDKPTLYRSHAERALELYRLIGERRAISSMYHNLAEFYMDNGLYKRAFSFYQQSLGIMEKEISPSSYLHTLHRAAMAGFLSGHTAEGLDMNARAHAESKAAGFENIEAFCLQTRGLMYQILGRYAEAQVLLDEAAERVQIAPGFVSLAVAMSGYNSLLMGDAGRALQKTQESLVWADEVKQSFLQGVYWFRYLALQRASGDPARAPEENWTLLDRACQEVLIPAANLHDEGLRRNYLSALIGNPEIITEWARQAHRRGLPLTPITEHKTSPDIDQDQFNRLLAFGTRLTSQRSPDDLLAFILDEFIELSGAERAFLALGDGKADSLPGIVLGHALETPGEAVLMEEVRPQIQNVLLSRQPMLDRKVSAIPEGDPGEIHNRSMLIIPLVLSGRALGVLYADIREIFGPFTRQDVDLLTVLGSQAAAALENAQWSQGLEQKVAERTAELSESNKIQAALYQIAEAATAAEDISNFYRRLHEIVRTMMKAENFIIQVYDEVKQRVSYPYVVDTSGELKPVPPIPLAKIRKGLAIYVLKTGKTLHLSKSQFDDMVKRGELESIGTAAEDWVGVPLQTGGRTIGMIAVQQYEPGSFYTEKDVRLLEFVAQQIATSLERAQAIQNTKRLLEETELRANELAIINSVQHGLASNLDIHSIFELVGQRISEIFAGHAVGLYRYDAESDLAEAMFMVERGVRHYALPFQPGPIGRHMLETKEALSIATRAEFEAIGAQTVGCTSASQSGIYAPLVVNDNMVGALNIENPDKEHAFTESDLRLLQTLASSMSVALENARLFDAIQTRNREISEALEREQATGQILGVIASSPTEIQPVLDVIAENAARLSGSDDAIITYVEGEFLRLMTHYGPIPILEVGELLPLNRETVVGRAVLERRPLQIIHEPGREDSEYPAGDANAGQFGYRMTFSTPLLRHGVAIGAITIRHVEPKLLTERQVKLVRTFADQAVIAIENV
ncbi:MAG TPA: GAF domain-containing protein, partial [Anaerolineales bacterium]|nr:GAF domain-containing protein [Anaerolineales bacterium]